ncbi:hypothetical protein [Paraburkholderia pallida]|uniref:Uncharacterized protein n=1 Tax=Paraburkholderia pallida TaxID=2547399 RepID=A0A4P7D6C7_9BURK|nr:hypothetical protein [Paraburkholderia pallida]QBR02182.1 hypothetical protein E1956_34310 [Paraburkholderia pallida]
MENPIGTGHHPMPEHEQDARFMELTRDTQGAARTRKRLATLRAMDPSMKAADLVNIWTADHCRALAIMPRAAGSPPSS